MRVHFHEEKNKIDIRFSRDSSVHYYDYYFLINVFYHLQNQFEQKWTRQQMREVTSDKMNIFLRTKHRVCEMEK